ncbi:mitochondrial carrier [Basidiobolus meristosporus CBS 931.73]|uniref:Mitochondrial carrier n=1 Tax=Basidiobolus meristosporus CBS 931.73 TaxID=1314790 RepID=A0A1Y1Y5P7_9FUNG|nr:mitochondrial carrier [Basidiobolus meristosporus CBS 931.73]|eukprot:ORX93332.1 mitochondrial carrier [Basidiobolus meristosporus CBS 931.73]
MESNRTLSVYESAVISAIAPAIAVFFSNPFDVAKVRMQLQGENQAVGRAYKHSFDCIYKMGSQEGFHALYKGIVPAVFREASKNLFRIGMFEPILNTIHNPNSGTSAPAWKRMVVGCLCGAMGALSCNPFELAKTRLQSSVKSVAGAKVGFQHGYTGLWDALRSIVKRDGFSGLYRGSTMSMTRSLVGSGSNMTIYSLTKESMLRRGYADVAWVDTGCGFFSAFWSVICMNPIDTLRTRYYNQPTFPDGRGQLYSSGFDAFRKVTKAEGYSALYKGFVSHFLRIGPHFALSFCFIGILRRQYWAYQDYRENRSSIKRLSLN